MLESALKTIHLQDYFLRLVLTTSSLSQACYLVMDNLLWLNSIGLVQFTSKRAKDYLEWSNKFWLYSSILYLARDLHDYIDLVKTSNSADEISFSTDPTRKYKRDETSGVYSSSHHQRPKNRDVRVKILLKQLFRIILMNRKNLPLLLDTIKNAFDVFLPLASLNYINISPGVQGVCGLVSSLIGLLLVWDSRFKLTP